MKKNIQFWKFLGDLKGIAIIGVVSSHILVRMAFSTFQRTSNEADLMKYMYFHELFSFSVPLFFFFSGYYLLGLPKTRKSLIHNTSKLIIPYFFWCIIGILYHILLTNEATNLIISFKQMIIGQYSIFWFLFLLVQYYLVSGIICHFFDRNNEKFLFIAFILQLVVTIFNYYCVFSHKLRDTTNFAIFPAPYFPNFFLYIVLGMWFKKKSKYVKEFFTRKKNVYLIILFLVISLVLLMFETRILYNYHRKLNDSFQIQTMLFSLSKWKLSQIMYSITIITLFLYIGQYGVFNKIQIPKRLGSKTFAIYLMHIFFIDILNYLLIRIYSPLTYNILGFFIYLTLLIAIPLLLRKIMIRILPPAFIVILGE